MIMRNLFTCIRQYYLSSGHYFQLPYCTVPSDKRDCQQRNGSSQQSGMVEHKRYSQVTGAKLKIKHKEKSDEDINRAR